MEFGKIRSFIWPVYRHEYKKFIPMLLMFFLISFNYNILRATKDALVVTARSSGAEAIPFIKVWAILPAAFLMTFLFTRLSNKLKRENVFYVLMSIFVAFFLLFGFVLYPNQESLHPHALADKLQDILPIGCKGLIAMFRNWTFTAFYIMSEMWSTIIMTVLFWGLTNEVTTVKDAKRFYAILAISANFSGIVSGQVSMSLHVFNSFLPFGKPGWEQSIIFINMIVALSAIVCMFIYRHLHKKGIIAAASGETSANPYGFSEIKMGMRKNFAYLAKSKYLISLAVIVVMYNISINLVEVVWKDQVRALFPDPSEFNAYMGKVLTYIGVISTVTAIFISGNLLRRFSWSFNALIVPMILLITGIGFFSFLLFKDSGLATVASLLGSTPLAIGVLFGTMQNCLSRAAKYTLFDSTKELAFIPLSRECKLKGKAAIDGVGSRLGKSGGSLIHQGLLMGFGTIFLSTPYVGIILLFSIGTWILAVKSLGKKFNELTSQNETLTVAEEVRVPSKDPLPSANK